MLDRIFATVSLLLFIGFLSFLFVGINVLDLRIVIVVCVLLAAYDFWRTLKNNGAS